MLTRRLQILLDEPRYERLAGEARRRGTSVAVLVREAIDAALPDASESRAEAGRQILSAPLMPVPAHPAALREELDAARGPRG